VAGATKYSSRFIFIRPQRLDPDGLGQLGADAQTNIANLTDDVCAAAEKFDAWSSQKPISRSRWAFPAKHKVV